MKARKNPAAVALGKLRAEKGPSLSKIGSKGGKKAMQIRGKKGRREFAKQGGLAGGAARAAALSPEERKAIAAKAARAMWAKKRHAQGLPAKPGDEEFL